MCGKQKASWRLTAGHVQAGVGMEVLDVLTAHLRAELLHGALPLPQSQLQSPDTSHVLLC